MASAKLSTGKLYWIGIESVVPGLQSMPIQRPRHRSRSLSGGLFPGLLPIAVVLACSPLLAAAAEKGPVRPITATWRGISLLDLAARLSDLSGLPVVVDRRLDPGRPVSLDATAEPLSEILARIAAEIGADSVVFDSHARLVPAGVAAGLRNAAADRRKELQALSPEDRRIAMTRAKWSWPDGARPRELIIEAAARAGIVIDGGEQLPHDHFPAAQLPALSLADRLDLVLAHFDRRLNWRPRGDAAERPTFSIVPIDMASAGAAPAGPRAEPPARPPRRPSLSAAVPPPEPTYSLAVAAPLEDLLATLAKRFGLRLEVDKKALAARGIAGGEIVRRTVKDATRDELLDAILEPLDLDWRIDDGRLTVGERGRND